jgi:hypothetical protein
VGGVNKKTPLPKDENVIIICKQIKRSALIMTENELLRIIDALKDINDFSHKEPNHLLPCIFNKNYDENFNSDWLAFILNPNVNSIGVEALNIILKEADIQINDDAQVDMEKAGDYGKSREVYLDTNNRIDFVIKIINGEDNKICLAIENKIYSGLSKEEQLTEYSKIIKEKQDYDGYEKVLIYLTINGDVNENMGDFIPFSHRVFVEKLKRIPLDPISHPRESFLIREYINNMEENILVEKNVQMSKEEIEAVAKHIDEMNKISRQKDAFYDDMKTLVYGSIDKLFMDYGYTKFGIRGSYRQWYKENWFEGWLHFEALINENDVEVTLHAERTAKHFQSKIRNDISSKFNYAEISEIGLDEFINRITNRMQELKEEYESIIDEYVSNLE